MCTAYVFRLIPHMLETDKSLNVWPLQREIWATSHTLQSFFPVFTTFLVQKDVLALLPWLQCRRAACVRPAPAHQSNVTCRRNEKASGLNFGNIQTQVQTLLKRKKKTKHVFFLNGLNKILELNQSPLGKHLLFF